MRALITGAGGFVGRWLATELLAAGQQVFGLILPGGHPPAEGVAPLAADLRDREALFAAVAEAAPDAVYHLAGVSAGSAQDRAALAEVNVGGTGHVLDAAGRLGRPVRVLLASTGLVYGECDPARPAAETDLVHPVGAYAESKWQMEQRAREQCRPPVALLIARAFNHTGPGQSPGFAVPAFARQIAAAEAGEGERVLRVGDLSPRRDFLDVRDVARAYHGIKTHGEPDQAYNIASGAARSMQEVLDLLLSLARVPVEVVQDAGRLRPADIRVSVGSAGRLRALTGWQPSIPLRQTLSDTLEYWRRSEA